MVKVEVRVKARVEKVVNRPVVAVAVEVGTRVAAEEVILEYKQGMGVMVAY